MVIFWISFTILLGVFLYLLGYLVSLIFKLKPLAEKSVAIDKKLESMRNSLNDSVKKLH